MTNSTIEPGQHYRDIQSGIFGRAAASDWIVEDVQTDPYGLRHAHLMSVADPTVRKTLAAEVPAGRQTAGARAGRRESGELGAERECQVCFADTRSRVTLVSGPNPETAGHPTDDAYIFQCSERRPGNQALPAPLGSAVGPWPSEAREATKILRVGYLGRNIGPASLPPIEAFREGLRQLGYIEGQNIIVEYRHDEIEVKPNQLRGLRHGHAGGGARPQDAL
jgi:hypothetical protein